MSQNLLTDDDVVMLTGYSKPGLQANYCRQNGIRHFINSQGRVIVPVSSLTKTIDLSTIEPDFGQFNAAQKRA